MRWRSSSNKIIANVLLEIDDLPDFTRYDWAMVRGCFCGSGTRASSSRLVSSRLVPSLRNSQQPGKQPAISPTQYFCDIYVAQTTPFTEQRQPIITTHRHGPQRPLSHGVSRAQPATAILHPAVYRTSAQCYSCQRLCADIFHSTSTATIFFIPE